MGVSTNFVAGAPAGSVAEAGQVPCVFAVDFSGALQGVSDEGGTHGQHRLSDQMRSASQIDAVIRGPACEGIVIDAGVLIAFNSKTVLG